MTAHKFVVGQMVRFSPDQSQARAAVAGEAIRSFACYPRLPSEGAKKRAVAGAPTSIGVASNQKRLSELSRVGFVTVTSVRRGGEWAQSGSCCCDGVLPLRCRFGSEDPQGRSRDEVSLKVERVMDALLD
jgi:hypothetical protein